VDPAIAPWRLANPCDRPGLFPLGAFAPNARKFAERLLCDIPSRQCPSSTCARSASPIHTKNPTEADPNSFAGKSVQLGDDHRLGNGVTHVVGIALPLWQFNDWMLDLVVIEQAEQMMNAI